MKKNLQNKNIYDNDNYKCLPKQDDYGIINR